MGKTFFEMTPAERDAYMQMVFPDSAPPDRPSAPSPEQLLTQAAVLLSCAFPAPEMTAEDWHRSRNEWRAAYTEHIRRWNAV